MNLKSQPIDGKFGTFGGKYVPETLMPVVDELEEKYNDIKENKEFNEKLSKLLKDYAGRSTPIYFAENLSKKYGAECWFKRPKHLSTDKAAKIPVVRHALIESEKFYKKKFDIVFDLACALSTIIFDISSGSESDETIIDLEADILSITF